METILKEIQKCFLDKEKYFSVLADKDARVEGWFKAELILLLHQLNVKFKPEYTGNLAEATTKNRSRTGYTKIDFCVLLNDEKHLFELKALCVSQKVTDRNLKFYFRDDNIGIINDFKKLDSLPDEKNKWVIGFVYPKPTSQKWKDAKAKSQKTSDIGIALPTCRSFLIISSYQFGNQINNF